MWKRYLGVKRRSYYSIYPMESETGKREHPGPLDNKDIIEDKEDFYKSDDKDDIYNLVLRPERRERIDYKIINDKQWEFLFARYGGTSIRREKYRPEHFSFIHFEVYFQRINLVMLPPRETFDPEKLARDKPLYASKRWTLPQLRERIVKVLNTPKYGHHLEPGSFRLWRLDPTVSYTEFMDKLKTAAPTIRAADPAPAESNSHGKDPDVEENTGVEFPGICLDLFGNTKILEKCDIADCDKIVLEVPDARGEYVFRYRKNIRMGKCEFCYQERPILVSCKCKEVHYCSEICMKKDEHFHAEKCSAIDMNEDLSSFERTETSNMGITGLQNLGNTCFMNSGLQCLSNTWQLSRYFLDNVYVSEINTDNKLGLQGRMAKSYAKLIKLLWYDNSQFVSPWDLKKVIGKFHSAFSGFAQQDSQELISTVLDALHEDLNRVKDKPYVEQQTSSDPNDNSASLPNWYNYLARNRSVIVDLFHGQFKSVVHCQTCSRYSVTFDPFSVISLPIPQDTNLAITFYYVPYNLGSKTRKCSIIVDKTVAVGVLREKLATLLGVHKDSFMFTMISGNTFDRFLCQSRPAKLITKMQKNQHSHLYLQEINPLYFNSPENIGFEKRRALAALEQVKEDARKKKEEDCKKSDPRPDDRASPVKWQTVSKAKSEPKDNDDYNNGLSDDLLRVTIHVFRLVKHTYWTGTSKERKSFNRLLYIRKSATMREVHFEVFRYFRPLLEQGLTATNPVVPGTVIGMMNTHDTRNAGEDGEPAESPSRGRKSVAEMTDEELFAQVFPDLGEENWQERLRPGGTYPYLLNMVNLAERSYFRKEKCYYCGNENCDNCPVPFSSGVKVSEVLAKLGSKEPIRNDYYYFEHRFYNEGKRDFELEVVFNEDRQKCILDLAHLEMVESDKTLTTAAQVAKPAGVSIYSCFDTFSNWETLDENNFWYCPTCQNSVQAKKRLEIIRAPPVLIIHLKRFKAKDTGMGSTAGGRLNTLIDFPIENLDLRKYVKGSGPEAAYNLYAVSNHIGSIGFGHYTAFAYNKSHDGWYRFDDNCVARAEPSDICTSAAYVLFYKRKDIPDEVDYERIKQNIAADYTVPVIESKPAPPKKSPLPMSTDLASQEELKVAAGGEGSSNANLTANAASGSSLIGAKTGNGGEDKRDGASAAEVIISLDDDQATRSDGRLDGRIP